MSSIVTQFYLLQYKSWKLQLRKKVVTLFEILIPVSLCMLMVSIRTLVKVNEYPDPTYFPSYSMDSIPEYLVETMTPPNSNSSSAVIGVAFTPKTSITNSIMARVQGYLFDPTNGPAVLLHGSDTEEEMVEYLTFNNDSLNIEMFFIAGIVFNDPETYKTSIPKNVSYTIRCKYNLRTAGEVGSEWNTPQVYPSLIFPGPAGGNFSSSPNYYNESFLPLQHALHRSIIKELNPSANLAEVSTYMERFPYPPYTDDFFLIVLQLNFPFFIMLCMIFFALNIPKDVTAEKEKKLKESMKMMGMANWLQWLSWFTKYFVFLFFTTFLMTLLLCPPYKVPANFTVLANSNFLLIWLFLMMYAVSIITFCFMISSIFNKANAAAAAGGIIFFLSYIPFSSLSENYDSLSRRIKLLSCLDLNMAMSLGMIVIGRYEGTGTGVQWDNLNRPVTVDDNITFGNILFMFLIDSVLHTLAMWYIDAVFPGTYGIPQPPYFFVLPSYWCGTKQSSFIVNPGSKVDVAKIKDDSSEYFETEPVNLDAGIQIKGLTKQFKAKGTNKTAVNKLSLNMYDGQITALLGHNGAGKTTTMFMLTGFIPPTSGTALVNGYDITKDISSVRSSLGLCPQHDILFDNLTVEEHLYFFAKLKSCPKEKIQSEIDYYIKTLGIEEKRKSFASTLSGGQKRKLSVGIALIGDSKIVILDEPTSGMDPSARRHMWDVLQAQRAGRTMILSTHFMDEADHLGDRIAILSDGVLQCCGSSLFLKKKYGAGYHMIMTTEPNCNVSEVDQLLTKHVPEAKLEGNVGAELSYILPDDKVSAFPGMFAELEQRKDDLGVLGFGASVTTMEEVFIKVGEGQIAEQEEEQVETIPVDQTTEVMTEVTKKTGFALHALQFKAMFFKRAIFTWRNKILTLSQILLPIFFTGLTILILKIRPDDKGVAPSRPINLLMFEDSEVLYNSGTSSSPTSKISKVFADQFDALDSHAAKKVDDPREEILDIADRSLKEYNFNTILATIYNYSDITILFNPTPYHSAPAALLYSDQSLLHHYVNDSYNFAATNHPLPQSANAEIETEASDTFNGNSFAYSSNMMFGFSFLAASFVFFLINERSQKVKHSQIVSGVKGLNFWLSTFSWDFINYMIPSLLVICLFAIADVKNLADIKDGNKQPLYLFLLMLMYGLAFLPYMYAVQFAFTGPATGYVVMVFVNLLTGIFPQLVVVILLAIESTRSAGRVLDWLFIVIFPNYNMGQGVGNLYTNYDYLELCLKKFPEDGFDMKPGKESLDEICDLIEKAGREFPCCKDNCGSNCLDFQENYLDWENLGIGRSLLFLAVQTVFFWIIVIFIESQIFIKLFYLIRPKIVVVPDQLEVKEDEDVAFERNKIMEQAENNLLEDNQVVISRLTKYFSNHKAVNNVCVAIPKGECFGLLGVNGAGKTTTFKMLTGDETISGGTAYMAGKNVRTDIHEVQKCIGYCPQFDALIDQMTGEEMLYMYARLRGVPEASIPPIVERLLAAFLLNKHRNKLTKDYSGGNKRKLSTAIALMGDPPIVFLDEPTTGMDPVARRMLWQALTQVRESGKTLILTSHSMEECEALCTRMAIMVNGQYRCLGSTQHLKNKFGAGYTLIARVSYPADGSLPDIEAVQSFVDEEFPGSVLQDKHQNLVQYHIEKGNVTWANVFEKLEARKSDLNIEDYSVSQTTLEQVFLNFARAQVPPNDTKPGVCKRFRNMCCLCCVPEYVVDPGSH